MTRSLTSLDAAMIITIPGVYPGGIQLQGWKTDDIFDLAAVKPNITRFGVDGVLSAGMQLQPRVMKIHLEASSESQKVFDNWASAEATPPIDSIPCSMTIVMNAAGEEYTCTRGFLTDYKDVADAKKVRDPLTYEITFQLIQKTMV